LDDRCKDPSSPLRGLVRDDNAVNEKDTGVVRRSLCQAHRTNVLPWATRDDRGKGEGEMGLRL